MWYNYKGSRLLLYKIGVLVARKELLLFQASLARAALTSQRQLRRAVLPAPQMVCCKVCNGVDKDGISIEALSSLDPRAIRLVDDFLVEFVKGLDVVTRKRDGDQ